MGAAAMETRKSQPTMTMKFETVDALLSWMTMARDTVLAGAACEVNWVHRFQCPVPTGKARGGADQRCACRPYAMLLIRRAADGGAR